MRLCFYSSALASTHRKIVLSKVFAYRAAHRSGARHRGTNGCLRCYSSSERQQQRVMWCCCCCPPMLLCVSAAENSSIHLVFRGRGSGSDDNTALLCIIVTTRELIGKKQHNLYICVLPRPYKNSLPRLYSLNCSSNDIRNG